MERHRPSGGKHEAPRTRIVWSDGPFRIECTVAGAAMRLCVHYGPHLMADEQVASIQAAWNRATEICRELSTADEDDDGYGTGSG